jgi:hypothetical protein
VGGAHRCGARRSPQSRHRAELVGHSRLQSNTNPHFAWSVTHNAGSQGSDPSPTPLVARTPPPPAQRTIPIVTPTRALFDLANDGETHLKKIERYINTGWARDLTSGQRLAVMAQEWCERGRTGSAFVHEYLAAHPISWQPPASNLEGRFRQIISEAGLPEPRRQVDVGGSSAWIGRVDFLDPALPLIAEIDSELFHGAPLDAASDELRDEDLRAAWLRPRTFHGARGLARARDGCRAMEERAERERATSPSRHPRLNRACRTGADARLERPVPFGGRMRYYDRLMSQRRILVVGT